MKHEYRATISWDNAGSDVLSGQYSRMHQWSFDGGMVVKASAAPTIVPPPGSDPALVDPEEALVASAASCHMLWFIDIARRAGYAVETYADAAIGLMGRRADGTFWMERIDLYPVTHWTGPSPTKAQVRQWHDTAHANCYIANSLRTEITIHPF